MRDGILLVVAIACLVGAGFVGLQPPAPPALEPPRPAASPHADLDRALRRFGRSLGELRLDTSPARTVRVLEFVGSMREMWARIEARPLGPVTEEDVAIVLEALQRARTGAGKFVDLLADAEFYPQDDLRGRLVRVATALTSLLQAELLAERATLSRREQDLQVQLVAALEHERGALSAEIEGVRRRLRDLAEVPELTEAQRADAAVLEPARERLERLLRR